MIILCKYINLIFLKLNLRKITYESQLNDKIDWFIIKIIKSTLKGNRFALWKILLSNSHQLSENDDPNRINTYWFVYDPFSILDSVWLIITAWSNILTPLIAESTKEIIIAMVAKTKNILKVTHLYFLKKEWIIDAWDLILDPVLRTGALTLLSI